MVLTFLIFMLNVYHNLQILLQINYLQLLIQMLYMLNSIYLLMFHNIILILLQVNDIFMFILLHSYDDLSNKHYQNLLFLLKIFFYLIYKYLLSKSTIDYNLYLILTSFLFSFYLLLFSFFLSYFVYF
jgi:hypothetical protein